MERLKAFRFVILALIVLVCGATVAQAADTYFENATGAFVEGVRCATPIPSLERTEQIAQEVTDWLLSGGRLADKAGSVLIPIAVHVLAHDDGYGDVTTRTCESGDMFRDGRPATNLVTLVNHPNPFNPLTVIEFSLVTGSQATLKIYDARGLFISRDIPANAADSD